MSTNKVKAAYAFITYEDGSRIKQSVKEILEDTISLSLGSKVEEKHGPMKKIEFYSVDDKLIESKDY